MRFEFPVEITAELTVIKAADVAAQSEPQEEQDNTDG